MPLATDDLLDALNRLLDDRPDEYGTYVHHPYCNFDRRKSVSQARCNCPISYKFRARRDELLALAARLEALHHVSEIREIQQALVEIAEEQ